MISVKFYLCITLAYNICELCTTSTNGICDTCLIDITASCKLID